MSTTIKFMLESGSMSISSKLTLSNNEWLQVYNACKKHQTVMIGSGKNRVDITYDNDGVCSARIFRDDTSCYIGERADETLKEMYDEALFK